MLWQFLAVALCVWKGAFVLGAGSEYEGVECGGEAQKGVCVKVLECPSAREALEKRKGHDLPRCGFEGFTEIVCCPVSENSVTGSPNTQVRGPVLQRKSTAACEGYTTGVAPNLAFQILGGENANLGEFPHMAALGYSDDEKKIKWKCGGSLITNRHVLTAAHCIIQLDGTKPTMVRLGKTDLFGNTDNAQPHDYPVLNYTIHPKYQRRSRRNDIAVIILSVNVTFNDNVHPACLYDKDNDPAGLVVTGWGSTSVETGETSSILQKATLEPVPVSDCNETYRTRISRTVTRTQICAVSDNGNKDTCQGDSGGPMQVQQRSGSGVYSIVGITSYGIGCGGKIPGVYTRVASYLDWVESIVWS